MKLLLENFQRHKKLVLPLNSPITCIVGDSDRGKSAILRALRWMVTNKPFGDAFITDGENNTRVVFWVDGHKIQRIRFRKGSNRYHVDGKVLEAFGTEAPKDVEKILQLTEANFQGQHESPYWFCETAGEVSRRLNAIVDLQIIDSTMANLSAGIRKTRAELEVCRDRLRKAETTARELRPVKELQKEWSAVESLQQAHEKTVVNAAALQSICETMNLCTQTVNHASTSLQMGNSLLKRGREWFRCRKQRKALENLCSRIQSLHHVSRGPDLTDFQGLERKAGRLKQTRERVSSLEQSLATIERWKDTIWQSDKKRLYASESLRKQIGKKCPLCGAKITS